MAGKGRTSAKSPFGAPTLRGPHPSGVCSSMLFFFFFFSFCCSLFFEKEGQNTETPFWAKVGLAKVGIGQSRPIRMAKVGLSRSLFFLFHCLFRARCSCRTFRSSCRPLPYPFLAFVSLLVLHRADLHRYWAVTIILSLQEIYQCVSKSSVISSILSSQIRPDWSWRSCQHNCTFQFVTEHHTCRLLEV